MAQRIIATGKNIEDAFRYEQEFEEGDIGEMRFHLLHPITQSELQTIWDQLEAQGVRVLSVEQTLNPSVLTVRAQQALAFLLPLIGVATTVLGTGFFGWQISKNVKETVQSPGVSWLSGGVIALGVLAAIVIFGRRKREKPSTEAE